MSIPDQDSFREAQAKHQPEDDLAPYMGRWVAVRDGKVVASDLSLRALCRQPEVEPSDHLMPVPRSRPGFLIVPLFQDFQSLSSFDKPARNSDGLRYGKHMASTNQEAPRPPARPADQDAVRLQRLRRDAERPMSVNLAEGIALSHQLMRFTGAARRN
jgi:hypothetical protein